MTRLKLVELYLDRATEAQRALAALAQRGRRSSAGPDHRKRHRPAAPPARHRLPRRRLRLHHRAAAPRRARPAADRVHAGHAARAQRGARPVDAGASWSTNWCASAPTPPTATRRSAAACSSCWCRWRSSPSWPAPARWCCSWTSDTARFPWELLDRDGRRRHRRARCPGRCARGCCASCARTSSAPAGGRRARGRGAGDRRAAVRQEHASPSCRRARRGARRSAKVLGTHGAARRRCAAGQSTRCWPSRCASCTSPATASCAWTARQRHGRRGAVQRHLLGPSEVRAMRTVPELVFVNCCFIGRSTAARRWRAPTAPRFAAGVAEQLIREGVRCVVAAGWAVDDGPAKRFASAFYQRLLAGDRFIDAVGAARRAAWEARKAGNTWAAYQCYGDPDWRYVPPRRAAMTTPAARAARAVDAQRAGAAAGDRSAGRAPRRRPQRCAALPGGTAPAAAAAAVAAGALRGAAGAASARWPRPSAWPMAKPATATPRSTGTRRAMRAGDGSASLRAAEQWANHLARRGAQRSDPAQGRARDPRRHPPPGATGRAASDGRARKPARLGLEAAGAGQHRSGGRAGAAEHGRPLRPRRSAGAGRGRDRTCSTRR